MKLRNRMFAVILCISILLGLGGETFPEAGAAEQMTASEACIEFIKSIEGFAKHPYYDYSQYTVGYGTKCPLGKYLEYKEKGITREAAEELLRQCVADVEEELNKRLLQKHGLTLSQNQFDALVSFTFNVGTGWLWENQKNSLRSLIIGGAEETGILYTFTLYSNAGGKVSPGLAVRRLAEVNMFLNGVYQQRVSPDYGYVIYDPNGGEVTYRIQGYATAGGAVPVEDARRKGDTFCGWYTALSGGTKVTELTGEHSGKTLYARWESEEAAPEKEETRAVTVKVTGDVVNLRKGPGITYGRIGQVYENDVLTVTSVSRNLALLWGETPKGWICLLYTNYKDVTGETPEPETTENSAASTPETVPETTAETLPPVQETKPLPPETQETTAPTESTGGQAPVYGTVKVSDGLRVRKGPGTRYALAGSLWNGNRVAVWQTQTVDGVRWGRTDQGWVCMDYLVMDGDTSREEESSTPEAENQSVLKGTVKADLLRVRSGPGTEYSVLAFYGNREKVEILDKVLNQGSYWGKTKLGWVSMDYIVLEDTQK